MGAVASGRGAYPLAPLPIDARWPPPLNTLATRDRLPSWRLGPAVSEWNGDSLALLEDSHL